MGNIANLLAKLANSLDRIGLRREASLIDSLICGLKTAASKLFDHTVDPKGNLLFIHGPLFSQEINASWLNQVKKMLEQRTLALQSLIAHKPPRTNVDSSPNEIEITFPYDLTITFSAGKVYAHAGYNTQAQALAKEIDGKAAEPKLIQLIEKKVALITEEEAPFVALKEPPLDEPARPSDRQIQEWANLLAGSGIVHIPADRFLLDKEDLNTRKNSPLKVAFRKHLEKLWEFRLNFFVADSFDGNILELVRRDRETDISMTYKMDRGQIEEEWLRIPDTSVRTDDQIERGTNRRAPDLKTYLDGFKTRTTEVACTQVVDKHYTLRRTWANRFGVVLKGIPNYICHKDANSDYDWWSGRKVPEKTPEGSKHFAKDRRDRLEAFIVPAKCSIPKIFVGPAFYRQGEVLAGEYEIGHDLAEHDLGRQTNALKLLETLHMDWSNTPSLGGEPPAAIRLIRPRQPGVGRGSQLFMTPEIAEWVRRNNGNFLGYKQLWDKASAVLAIFPEKPSSYPAKAEGFHGIDAIPLSELPRVSARPLPSEYQNRPTGKGFEACTPSALKARVIRESRQPFAIVERDGNAYALTTDIGFEHLRRLLNSPLCGKQPSRYRRMPLSQRS